MSYEEASRREAETFAEMERAVAQRGRVDAKAAIYSEHRQAYDDAVDRLVAAAQAYEAAAIDLLKARSGSSI